MKTIVFNLADTVELDKNEASMLFASSLYEKDLKNASDYNS